MESSAHASPWIAVAFAPDTRIQSLSPGIERRTGYPGGELIGHSISGILADSTLYEMPEILDTVRAKGRWEGEIACRDSSRNVFKFYATILPMGDGANRNAGFLLLASPAESANPTGGFGTGHVEVGSRIRELVHDLNNPLAVSMGSTQLLALNSGCTGKIRSDIEKLYEELGRIAGVVEKLHAYALSLSGREGESSPEESRIQNSA